MPNDDLGDRMKRYEASYNLRFVPRLPLLIRVDGKSFHTLTRTLQKPFDTAFVETMQQVALTLCKEITGAMCAYVQSDEISILVRDDQTLQTQAWFNKELNKVVSLTAGIASAEMSTRLEKRAIFDSRAFILPHNEVANYFIWRQQDATRNSVSMVAYAELGRLLGQKEAQALLQGKSWAQQQELLWQQCNINWSRDYLIHLKRGACIVPGTVERTGRDGIVLRRVWKVDSEPPTFTQERSYIERFLETGNELSTIEPVAQGADNNNGNI